MPRRPFDSYLLKKWLRRQNNHLYENWPDIDVEQDENFDHVLPTQDHSTEDDLDSLSNAEFLGENIYDTVDNLYKYDKYEWMMQDYICLNLHGTKIQIYTIFAYMKIWCKFDI